MGKYPNLIEDIKKAPTIIMNERGQYVFHAFSVGERGTRLPHSLVDEVVKGLLEKVGQLRRSFDYIVSVVPAGSQWGLLVANELKKPLAVIIDHTTGLPGEFKIHQTSSVYDRDLFFSGFKARDKVILLDDVISTGATTSIVVKTLRERYRVNVIGIFCIITKGDAYKQLEESTPLYSLVNLALDGRIIPKKA